ncbi:MAG: ATP-binding cassette domain-containing protein [Thermodesulfobacteriota bacterium]|nr:ATP-binding cassette domain-containing protein [Thermodesulfobacteriota bacterium]
MTPKEHALEIRLENLSVGYSGKVVLRDINVTLPTGKISVLLGGSGCGKSTLLRHILGLSPPIKGSIHLGSQDMYGLEEKDFHRLRQKMGVLFQDGALLGSMTLGENVALPLREHTDLDEDIIETVVRMKLGLVGLESFIDYFPSQLSGGMRKRAGLARAMALDPGVLLCDEPSSGLDPITAAELDRLLLDLLSTFSMTIVVVTHDLQSMFTIAQYVVVLHDGRAIFQGTLEELKQSSDPYIKDFLERKPPERARQAVVA